MSSSVAILGGVSSERRKSYSNPVKAWTDAEAWAERVTREGCPLFERSSIDPHAVTPQHRSADEIESLRRAIAEIA